MSASIPLPLDPGQWRVMMADDHVESLMIIKMLMEHHHAQCLTVNSGLACLEQLPDYDPNVLLLDLQMPKKSGWEVMREVRAMPKYKDLLIIAVTAHTMEGDRAKIIGEGFSDHIPKPVKTRTFISEIQEIISRINALV